MVEDVLGIPKSENHILEYDDCVNLMKGAIETAHRVTTVSPTYAQEILDPWYSHELDGILRERSWKLTGILNGIDTVSYDRRRIRISTPTIRRTISATRRKTSALCKNASAWPRTRMCR